MMVPLLGLRAGDNFTDRVQITGTNGVVAGSNRGATREPGEPLHAGKRGGKSVWYKWRPDRTGIATIGTTGSDFDTLLAVYQVKSGKGAYVTNLVSMANDEDRGGYFTSGIRFNVGEDIEYEIAIDGFSGDQGDFAFNWNLERTTRLLPAIRTNPVSQTVLPDTTVKFTVAAVPVCASYHEDCPNSQHYDGGEVPTLQYQWLFNGVPLAGQTRTSLTVSNVNEQLVGNYSVQVTQVGRTVESPVASLQINLTDGALQNVQVYDKYQDAYESTPLLLGGGGGVALRGVDSVSPAVVVAGYSGSQVFNTTAGTSQGEVFCDVIGGSSEWLNFAPAQSGLLSLNTDGSSFDTLLAVAVSNAPPQLLACDNNSGRGGSNSAVVVPVVAGQNYLIGVDGVNGAFGRVVLNYNLNVGTMTPAPVITSAGKTNGAFKFQITGITNKFCVLVSTNFASWTPLVTNPAPVYLYDFVDWRSTNFPRRFYRVQVLP